MPRHCDSTPGPPLCGPGILLGLLRKGDLSGLAAGVYVAGGPASWNELELSHDPASVGSTGDALKFTEPYAGKLDIGG